MICRYRFECDLPYVRGWQKAQCPEKRYQFAAETYSLNSSRMDGSKTRPKLHQSKDRQPDWYYRNRSQSKKQRVPWTPVPFEKERMSLKYQYFRFTGNLLTALSSVMDYSCFC